MCNNAYFLIDRNIQFIKSSFSVFHSIDQNALHFYQNLNKIYYETRYRYYETKYRYYETRYRSYLVFSFLKDMYPAVSEHGLKYFF